MGIKFKEHGDSSFWHTVNILMVSRVLFDLQILRVKSVATVHELTKILLILGRAFTLGSCNWIKPWTAIYSFLNHFFLCGYFNGYTSISDTPVNILSFILWSHNQEKF